MARSAPHTRARPAETYFYFDNSSLTVVQRVISVSVSMGKLMTDGDFANAKQKLYNDLKATRRSRAHWWYLLRSYGSGTAAF